MWDLMVNDEQAMIADAVAQFLAAELPIERLRLQAGGAERQVWSRMAELGWFAAGLPESAGGMGLGLVEEMTIQRGCGRHLASPSILATVLAAHVAQAAGDAAMVAALTGGHRRAALCHAAGDETLAFDWSPGDLLLGWDEDGAALYAGETFVGVRPDVSLDESVALCRGVLGRPICHVATEVTPIPQRADALLAARLVGLAEGACTLATSYAQLREQFGKPIGSFQAIKHRCADMYLRAEMSAQLVALACLKIEAGAADAALQVAAARLKSAQSAYENGRAVIQVHGGLGFHAECDAHRFVKRAHVYDQIGGNLHAQARRVFAAQSPLW